MPMPVLVSALKAIGVDPRTVLVNGGPLWKHSVLQDRSVLGWLGDTLATTRLHSIVSQATLSFLVWDRRACCCDNARGEIDAPRHFDRNRPRQGWRIRPI
jgi:hypothetical protein